MFRPQLLSIVYLASMVHVTCTVVAMVTSVATDYYHSLLHTDGRVQYLSYIPITCIADAHTCLYACVC